MAVRLATNRENDHTSTAKQPKLEYRRGIDYAVIMRPEDTTDTALIDPPMA